MDASVGLAHRATAKTPIKTGSDLILSIAIRLDGLAQPVKRASTHDLD